MKNAHPISDMQSLLNQIREFQLKRIEDTYADFLRQPQFNKLGDFFRNYVYSVVDQETKKQRDVAFEKVYEKAARALGAARVEAAAKMIALNTLTDKLDENMAEIFLKEFSGQSLNRENYEACYVMAKNQPDRLRQIEYLIETTTFAHKLSRFMMLGWGIKLVKAGTKKMGIDFIMNYFEAGYDTFRDIKSITEFLNCVKAREFSYMHSLFSSKSYA